MQHGISTHVFLPQRLTPALLDTLHTAGAQAIEVFASRHHFDYTDRDSVHEAANWFRSNNVAVTMHMPIFSEDEEANWSRHTQPTLNLIDTNKNNRIVAMDEVKRALEAAEQIPFRSCVLHLGRRDDEWDSRALDDSMTAIEHLKAFASPLGVQLLLENLTNAVATPANLLEILRVGHFANVGICLDVGHAHLASSVPEAFELLAPRIKELHLHDNHALEGGLGDEHLWPGGGSIDWKALGTATQSLAPETIGMFEIAYDAENAAKLNEGLGGPSFAAFGKGWGWDIQT
jgi:sugar phosphate isomerase/epimerase